MSSFEQLAGFDPVLPGSKDLHLHFLRRLVALALGSCETALVVQLRYQLCKGLESSRCCL